MDRRRALLAASTPSVDDNFGDLPTESTSFGFPLYLNITKYSDIYECYYRERDNVSTSLYNWIINNVILDDFGCGYLELSSDTQVYINGAQVTSVESGFGVCTLYGGDLPFNSVEILIGGDICGYELKSTVNYEVLEYLVFDGTKIFDTGVYANEKTTIDIKFQRTNTSSNVYLYGVSTSPRLTANLAQSGYWRYGEGAYPTFNTKNTNVIVAEVTPTRTKVGSYNRTYNATAFTTKFPIPLGGHIPSSGVPTPQFIGYIYYFQMSIDGVLVADWIPVRRLSDGLDCFFDKVTNTFIEPIQ